MSTPTASAVERILRLPDIPAAAQSYRTVGVTTRIALDGGAQAVLLTTDGAAHVVTAPSSPVTTSGEGGTVSTDPTWPVPDITVELASEDLLALADGHLTVLRAVTTSRLGARGPIFAAIGVTHALTHL